MDHKPLNTPQRILEGGSGVIYYAGKERVYTVRKVFYDDDMTPLYSKPTFGEHRYRSLQDLKVIHPQKSIWNSPILDRDHSLKIYNHEETIK